MPNSENIEKNSEDKNLNFNPSLYLFKEYLLRYLKETKENLKI